MTESQRRLKPLAAKLTPPHVEQASLRPETLAAVERGCARRLTLVCAPAGYGKTTSIAAAFERLGIKPVWYKLDVLDHDPVVFLGSLVEAFRLLFAEFGQPIIDLLRFGHESPPSLEHLLALFLEEVNARVQQDIAVVIDDYHEAADSPELNGMLERLLTNAPANLRFTVLSRYVAAFPTGRLRVAGEVNTIGVELLRFDAEQIAHVLESRARRRLTKDDIERLVRLTEGWPASVALVGQALDWLELDSIEQALTDPRMKQDVYSYLAEQVYRNQDAPTRHFLDRTCCLEHITEALAGRISGMGDAHVRLNHLAVNRVFTFELEPRTYRYHTLFREFLRHNFVHEHGEAALRALQVDTARALEVAGSVEMAIELLFNANEPAAALEVLARAGEPALDSFPTESLVTWLSRLTSELRADEPWAHLLASQVHLRSGRLEDALLDVTKAASTFEVRGDTWGLYHALSAREGVSFWMGDLTDQVRTCEKALEYATTDAQQLHTLLSLGSAAVDRRDWTTANTAFASAEKLMTHASPQERARAQALRSLAAYTQGDYRAAISGFPETPSGHLSPLLTATVLNAKGLVEASLARYVTALGLYDSAQDVAQKYGIAVVGLMVDSNRALALSAQGRGSEGLAIVRGALSSSRETATDPVLTAYAFGSEAVILRRLGMNEQALASYRLARGLVSIARDPFVALDLAASIAFTLGLTGAGGDLGLDEISEQAAASGLAYVSLAAILFSAILAGPSNPEESKRLLAACLPRQLSLGHLDLLCQELCPRPDVAVLGLRALTDPNDQGALLRALACHWTFPAFFKRLSQDLPDLLADGLTAAAEHCGDDALADVLGLVDELGSPRLLAAADLVRDRRPLSSRRSDAQSLLPDLTKRELEVLRLMAAGLRNPDIAEQLFLTNATVKTHVNHIFYKLGVSTRVQAILRYQKAESGRSSPPADSSGTVSTLRS